MTNEEKLLATSAELVNETQEQRKARQLAWLDRMLNKPKTVDDLKEDEVYAKYVEEERKKKDLRVDIMNFLERASDQNLLDETIAKFRKVMANETFNETKSHVNQSAMRVAV